LTSPGTSTGTKSSIPGAARGPALRAKGAIVTGIDGRPAMVELARQRLGDDAALHVADLSRPLPFADGAFDDIVASLVLPYLRDWAAPLAELPRFSPGTPRELSSRSNHPSPRGYGHTSRALIGQIRMRAGSTRRHRP
jgi:hypothetical protein